MRKINECRLTLALYYHNVKEKRDPYLKEYLKVGGNYPEYAEALLNDGLENKLKKNKKEYLILGDINFVEYHFYGYHHRLLMSEEISPKYVAGLEKMIKKHYPNKEFVSVRQASDRNFKQLMEILKVGTAFDFFNYFLEEEAEAEAEREWEESVQEAYYFEDDEDSGNEETYYFDDDGDAADKEKKEEVKEEVKEEDEVKAEVKEEVKVEEEAEVEEEPERGPLNAFILNPYCWQYFYDNKLKRLEYLKVTSLDDQTAVATAVVSVLLYLYPGYWYRAFTKTESNRYAYLLQHGVYGIKSDDIAFYEKTVSYKMRKEYLINSTYHMLKESE